MTMARPMDDIADSVRSALRNAGDGDGIATALARAAWFSEHKEECPGGFVPSLQSLADWLFTAPFGDNDTALRAEARENSREALCGLLGGSWKWSRQAGQEPTGACKRKGKAKPPATLTLLAVPDGHDAEPVK